MAAVCHSCHLAALKVQALNDTFTLSMKSLRAAKLGEVRGVPARVKLAEVGEGVDNSKAKEMYSCNLVCMRCEECVVLLFVDVVLQAVKPG